jgi:hypothetical protein
MKNHKNRHSNGEILNTIFEVLEQNGSITVQGLTRKSGLSQKAIGL